MRLIFILSILLVTACGKRENTEAPAAANSFVPKTCSFVGTEISDPRYENGPVDKYACETELDNMSCAVFAQGNTSLRMACELISPQYPQGVPSNCTRFGSNVLEDHAHEFLDGKELYSEVYDCGKLNGNLRCFYFKHPSTNCVENSTCAELESPVLHEELRCNLI